jgi:ABC-2 type transport system ATP-binding protein
MDVTGVTAAHIGELAARSNVVLHELTPVTASLEEAYLELTQDEVEYHAGGVPQESLASVSTEGSTR